MSELDFINDRVRPSLSAAGIKLTKKQTAILRYITENIDDAIFMTLRQMCASIGCSQVTMMRLCRELGYESFVDFRSAVRDIKSGRFPSGSSKLPAPDGSFITDAENQEKKLLWSFFDSVDKNALMLCAQKISEADFVLILGSGISGTAARLLSHRLTLCSVDNIAADPLGDPSKAHGLARVLTSKSVIIAIDYPEYCTEDSAIIRSSAMHGVFSASVTDSALSPAAQTSSVSLICPQSESMLAVTEMVNLLILAVRSLKEK